VRESVGGIKHPAFRDAVALTRQGGREATGRYLVEDADQVRQALASSSPVYAVFSTPEGAPQVEAACVERDVPLYILGGGLITKLLGTAYATSTTAVALVGQRTVTLAEVVPDGLPSLILAGERIQDPRNVGVLIRTAEAAGCAAFLLSADSAEPFSRQAVRSTTGSILRLPLCLVKDFPYSLAELRDTYGTAVIATSARAPHLAYETDLSLRPLVLTVGNETEGLTEAARDAASAFVRLPMAPKGASSLNVTVAAGVLVYEAIRQGLSPT